ncbi:MAG TPA: adenosylmethionine--8-amino-7-oxononanoate transaminase [Dehalococcoidia bacterium]|nr:adenosylmethionine--8-amino-7-oxononanoate transaminase [Dehalococcoidia bacterium]
MSSDRYPLWHPFTQMARFHREPQLVVARAEGNRLIDTEGREYIDGVASLWANVHGHSNSHIVAAIQAQTAKLQHSTLLGITHEPAIELGRRLLAHLPGRSHVFFSENGASAVEVALKMAVQYWSNRGQPERNRIAVPEMAYHGDTIGAVSVGGEGPFRDVYGPLLFEPLRFNNAYRYRCDNCATGTSCTDTCLQSLGALLEARSKEIAAVIIEPRVQGAAGMIVAPEGHIAAIRALCDKFDVLLIADEVATGFGKTGAMFACDLEGVIPDITVLGKGITGGYLPLSATVTTEKVYQAFHGEEGLKLFHGHTYAGNPICCAAAIASFDIFESEQVLVRARERSELLATLLADLVADHPIVGDIRQQGLMIGIELVGDRETRAPLPAEIEAGWQVCIAARDRGVFIRPLGDVIVLMPPLSIEEDELTQICEAVVYGLNRVPSV